MDHYVSKRIFSVCISIVMALSLCACGNNSKSETSETLASSVTGSSEMTVLPTTAPPLPEKEEVLKQAPEAYLDAILIQINPLFLLYVNEFGEVIKGEALNEDAKSLMPQVALDGRNVNDALTDIVNASVNDGFLKDGGTVNITMMESFRSESDAGEQMKNLESVVVAVGRERNIDITPATKIADDVQYAQDQPGLGEPGDPNQPGDPNPPDPNQTGDPNQPGDPNPPDPNANPDQPGQNDPNPPPEKDDHDDHGGNGGGGKEEGCPVCQGSGVCVRCDRTGYTECGRCHGSGEIDCHNCNDGYDPNPCPCGGDGLCYRCSGTGTFEDKTCDVCDGNGKCKECGGVGRRTCKFCSGSGIISCDECKGSGKEECQGCHGTLVCEACDGTGKNIHKNG